MTRALGIIAGTALILMYATMLLLIMPAIQLRTGENPPEALAPYTESQARGREHYISLGCVYCHSQQPRDPSLAPDMMRGWGRPSVPADYSYDTVHLMGTMRTGPDLFNIGARQPSIDWHLTHLYAPRSVSPGSNMPAYPFLFEVTDYVPEGATVVNLPPEYRVRGGSLIATQEAMELVDYLIGLDHTYPTDELPQAPEEPEAEGDENVSFLDTDGMNPSSNGLNEAAAEVVR